MEIPITQSREWQKLQADLGEKVIFEAKDNYQFLAIIKKTPVGNYLFLPYGPVADSETSYKQAFSLLKDYARQNDAIFIRVEPQDIVAKKALPNRSVKVKDIEPADTWLLDLPEITAHDPLEDQNFKALLPSRLLRYYKSMAKQGITIETSEHLDDIHHLVMLQKSLASKKHITPFSEHYLKTELSQPFATLYLLKKDQKIIASGLVFDDDYSKTRYNLQGAQSEEGRSLHATGILTIQLIIDASKKGYKTFDFWGIAPEGADKNHPWYGFTEFKKSFGGYPKSYAGTYDIILKPIRYKLFNILKKFSKIIK